MCPVYGLSRLAIVFSFHVSKQITKAIATTAANTNKPGASGSRVPECTGRASAPAEPAIQEGGGEI